MLQQSQSQFTTLDRKYSKAKRLVREYQQREVDMVRFISYLENCRCPNQELSTNGLYEMKGGKFSR